MLITTKIRSEFEAGYIRGAADECWPWIAATSSGYGSIYLDGNQYLAHRVAYEITYKDLSDDLVVCHACDNPIYVNPKHLFQGTQKDNIHDCVSKVRFPLKEKHGMAKLTQVKIDMIRWEYALGISSTELARKYDVSARHIRRIASYRRWS